MLQVLTTALGAVGGRILDVVEQGDMLKEHHPLPICVFASPTSDHFQGSGVSINGALGYLVGATACGAPAALLLPWALRHDMPYLLASKAPDNPAAVWVITMEDGHLHCSPGSRWEGDCAPDNSGCFSEGGLDWGMARVYGDWVNETVLAIQFFVCIADLQPLFTEVQLPFHGHQLLHDLHDPPLGLPHQPLQCILELTQTPIRINFPMVLGVINLGECHVDGEFPFIPLLQVPPLDRVHAGVSGDLPIQLRA